MEIVRLKLTPDVVTPPSQRWDEISDEVQITPDGGATWYPDPALDPRTSSVYRQPERTGTDPKCDAATDMALTLQALVNTTIDTIGTVQTANAILAIIVVFTPGFGWLVRLVLALVEAILAIGSTVIDAAFTQAVYDDFVCLFYDNIGADGQMSDAQLADLYDDVAATQDATVQAVFGYFSSMIGAVGWSNAGAVGENVGDCDSCIPQTVYTIFNIFGENLVQVEPNHYTVDGYKVYPQYNFWYICLCADSNNVIFAANKTLTGYTHVEHYLQGWSAAACASALGAGSPWGINIKSFELVSSTPFSLEFICTPS